MSERFPWQIDAVILALTLLALFLFVPSCCPLRAVEVGVLTGMGVYSPEKRDAAMAEINQQCQPEKTESKASLRCWYVSPGGSLECEKP